MESYQLGPLDHKLVNTTIVNFFFLYILITFCIFNSNIYIQCVVKPPSPLQYAYLLIAFNE